MQDLFDVAIVGYGPVGMCAAALLARAGHRVVVLERYAGLYNLPRAAIFDDETMRTFARLGIASSMLPRINSATSYEWRNGDGALLIEHAFAQIGRSGWGEWYQMYQPDLEDALDRTCRTAGVDVRFDHRVTGYTQDADHVVVTTEQGTVTARYVIACDGGNSFTRGLLGIGQDDFGFSEPWMVCDFKLAAPTSLPQARQVCDPAQPISIISLGPAHHRFSFMLDSEAAFETERTPERVWARVAKYLEPAQAELIRVATYTFRSLIAHRWRDGRILLAGDAAHQMPPFLGQGMCSGIRDAMNLALKLDAVLRGHADTVLLDTYQTERAPHVLAVIQSGIELGKVQTMRDPVLAAARDRRFFARREAKAVPEKIRFPGIGPGFVGEGGGELMVQGFVQRGADPSTRARFDDHAGYGWTVISTPALPHATLPPWIRHVVLAPTALADCDGTYADWFAAHQAIAVIVRPDFYVYGTASTPADLARLVAELTGRIHEASA